MAEPQSVLNVITESAIQFLQNSADAEKAVVDNAKKGEAISAESEGIYRQIATDQAAIAYQQGLANLRAQQAARKAAAAAGVDPTNESGTIVELLSTMRQNYTETADLYAKRRAELNVNPLTSPISWLKAQVDWNATGFNLETKVTELERADKFLGAVNARLQESVRTTNVLQEGVTQATVEAGARVAAGDALLRAQQAALEGLKFNSAAVIAVKDANLERIRMLYDINNAARQEEQFKLALEQFSWQKEKWNWDKEQKKLEQEAKAVGKLADDLSLEYINKSLASMGQPPLDPREVATQLQLFKSGASKELQYHYQNGRRIATTGISMIGATPSEAVEVMQQIPSNLPEVRAQVAALLAQAKGLLDQSKDPRLTDDKANAGNRAQFINSRVNGEIARQYSSIVTGSGNLFDVGDIGAFIGTPSQPGIRQLLALPISQKLFVPAIQAGQPLSDPKIVLGLTLEAIRKGTLTTSEASSGLSAIYGQANLINQAQRGFLGFGIVPPNAGKNYYARIGAFGDTVDLADPNEIGRYINKESAKFAYKNMLEKRNQARRTDPLTGQPYGR